MGELRCFFLFCCTIEGPSYNTTVARGGGTRVQSKELEQRNRNKSSRSSSATEASQVYMRPSFKNTKNHISKKKTNIIISEEYINLCKQSSGWLSQIYLRDEYGEL